jgi:hypothetical protein
MLSLSSILKAIHLRSLRWKDVSVTGILKTHTKIFVWKAEGNILLRKPVFM